MRIRSIFFGIAFWLVILDSALEASPLEVILKKASTIAKPMSQVSVLIGGSIRRMDRIRENDIPSQLKVELLKDIHPVVKNALLEVRSRLSSLESEFSGVKNLSAYDEILLRNIEVVDEAVGSLDHLKAKLSEGGALVSALGELKKIHFIVLETAASMILVLDEVLELKKDQYDAEWTVWCHRCFTHFFKIFEKSRKLMNTDAYKNFGPRKIHWLRGSQQSPLAIELPALEASHQEDREAKNLRELLRAALIRRGTFFQLTNISFYQRLQKSNCPAQLQKVRGIRAFGAHQLSPIHHSDF